ncbi:MAG: 30S ribosomal protein S13 [Candidatus Roizmanbacteria bacterium]
MKRLQGITLPEKERVEYALTLLYGIGPSRAQKTLVSLKISSATRVADLSEDDMKRLQTAIEVYKLEGDLREDNRNDIKRLKEIGSFRGARHSHGLPARGQRTRSNARTNRGKRKTVGSFKKEDMAKQAPKKN